jgi:protein-S-isoprenylcysteine O-methyltransferase Ste14
MTGLRRLDLPPVWGALAWAMIALWARVASLAPIPEAVARLGWLAVAAGAGFVIWAAIWFRRLDTPIEPRQTPRALITGGPYRLTRNPIYRGMVWATAGWAIASGELTALGFAAAYAWLLWRRFVLPEEKALAATFGEAYADWARRTPARL